jgi:hypothetical protein
MNATEFFIKWFKPKTREEAEAAHGEYYFYNPEADTREPAMRGSNVFSGYAADPVVQNVDGKTNRVGAMRCLQRVRIYVPFTMQRVTQTVQARRTSACSETCTPLHHRRTARWLT